MKNFQPSKKYGAKHCSHKIIQNVEFTVLHYTALNLQETLDIFLKNKTSCHIIIDENGEAFEYLPCWQGQVVQAAHAGKSRFCDKKGKTWSDFNNFSIGIEMINLNGNIFPYTEKQYLSLFKILNHFKTLYPALKDSERILGHEHIAGYRGKSDPGYFFDWARLFKEVYPEQISPKRASLYSADDLDKLGLTKKFKNMSNRTSLKLSLIMESRLPWIVKKLKIKLLHFFYSIGR